MATRTTADDHLPKTLAQKYCLITGLVLLLIGILGFFVDSSFSTTAQAPTGAVEGDELLGFEVNGWHNLVHLASGLVLLAAANSRPTAKTVAIGFGVVYGLVFLIGLIQGDEVLGLIPVNGPDHVLHFLLAAAGIAAGLASATTKASQRRRTQTGTVHEPPIAASGDETRTRVR